MFKFGPMISLVNYFQKLSLKVAGILKFLEIYEKLENVGQVRLSA